MNTTHPDALPLSQRERNNLLWQIAPLDRGTFIVNANGETVLRARLGRETALFIVREHNRLIRQLID